MLHEDYVGPELREIVDMDSIQASAELKADIQRWIDEQSNKGSKDIIKVMKNIAYKTYREEGIITILPQNIRVRKR